MQSSDRRYEAQPGLGRYETQPGLGLLGFDAALGVTRHSQDSVFSALMQH